MQDAFHCPKSRGEVIKAGREIVASKGLFITKKRYAVLYYDKEGKRTDTGGAPGKIKAMGLDENYIRKTIYEDVGKLKSSPVFYLINYKFTTHPEMENYTLIIKTNLNNKNKS
jgi:hypothetical protein